MIMAGQRNPTPTVDAVIADPQGRVVLIRRKNPPYGWALPGGFIDAGESAADACRREAREETCLDVELVEQLFTYSDPRRDPRQFTLSVVFACRGPAGKEPCGADDAQEARYFAEAAIPWADLCFDHAEILRDYFRWAKTGERRKL